MTPLQTYSVFPLGTQAILIRWAAEAHIQFLPYLLAVKSKLMSHFKVEVVHTYDQMLLKMPPSSEVLNQLAQLLDQKNLPIENKEVVYQIPVCYDLAFGLDLNAFAKAKQVTPQTIVDWHCAPRYTIAFLGFLPGFPYLLGLDPRLYTPRKAKPAFDIPKGAVAIGGRQTGIYPQQSPGGWHVIGNTPLRLFDPDATHPSPFIAGDRIQFEPVHLDEYQAIAEEVAAGTYHLKTILS